MKQLYEAVDKIDGEISYFFFDDVDDRHTVVSKKHTNKQEVLMHLKNTGGHWLGGNDRRADMINPVLIAEW